MMTGVVCTELDELKATMTSADSVRCHIFKQGYLDSTMPSLQHQTHSRAFCQGELFRVLYGMLLQRTCKQWVSTPAIEVRVSDTVS
jgi:hypothetical protein